jgi:hypothetical protein
MKKPRKGPTQDDLALALHCSVRTIREYFDTGVLPRDVLAVDDAIGHVLKHLRAKASGKAPKTAALEDARSQSLHIDIERKRLELAELQGDVVRVSVWRDIARQVFMNIRTKLLTAPNKCAALVSPEIAPIVQETVKSIVTEALREIADEAVPRSSGERGGQSRAGRVAGRSGQRSSA